MAHPRCPGHGSGNVSMMSPSYPGDASVPVKCISRCCPCAVPSMFRCFAIGVVASASYIEHE